MLLIDKYAYTNKLRDLNPMVKFSFAMGMLIISLLPIPIGVYPVIFLAMSFLTVVKAKIPFKNYVKMLTIPVTFLLLSVVSILISFSYSGDMFIWSFNFNDMFIGVTKSSITMGIRLTTRTMACIACMYFYSLTTPIDQQIEIYKKLRIPREIIELMVLIYRFIFIFLEEAKYMRLAQEMRFGYSNFKNSCRSFSNMVKLLFIRVMKRNKDMQISLESKFFNGEFYI